MRAAEIPIYREPEEELIVTIDVVHARELRRLERESGAPPDVIVNIALGRLLEDEAKGLPFLPSDDDDEFDG